MRSDDLELNPRVHDADGVFLGRPDVLDDEAGVVLEYDGGEWESERETGHRDPRQHREDNIREEGFERAGLIVCRADKADVGRHRTQLVQRLLRARSDGLSRDRRRDRWVSRVVAPARGLGQEGGLG